MTSITRRTLLLSASAFGAVALTAGLAFAEPPKLAQKDTYKVGFAQTESNNPWRIAQTKSMQDEAKPSSATSSSIPTPPARPPSRSPT